MFFGGRGNLTGTVFVGDTLSRVLQEEQTFQAAFETLKASFEPHQDGRSPTSIILSGHGNQTSLEAEIATNPFFQD